jgi:hypothetical protein
MDVVYRALAATLQKVIHEEVPRPSALNSSVQRDLETICLKCLDKESARRYDSAGQLAEELVLFLNGRYAEVPAHARKTVQLARGETTPGRNRPVSGPTLCLRLRNCRAVHNSER